MFGGRVFEAPSQAAACFWAGSTWTGLVLVGGGAGRQTPCPGQARLAGWWGREGPGLQLEGPRAALHGVINLLTQGWAGTLRRVTRSLAFCQPTNPLTRPQHALLTPRSRTLLTLQLKGLERGWDVGAEEAPAVPARGPESLCRPTFRGRAGNRTPLSAPSRWATLSESPHLSEPEAAAWAAWSFPLGFQ